MFVLELGNYIVPAYAGMILAEQGHTVVKWTNGKDPILNLNRGRELWQWVNHGKTCLVRHPSSLATLNTFPDIIIDNFRPSALARWKLNPEQIASSREVVWVSLRSEVGERSFDILAQCRSWMEFCPWMPFYIGDTVAGLWLAFKALAITEPGHYVIGHASCLQKLVEGELVIDVQRDSNATAWDDPDNYCFRAGVARVLYRGQCITETPKDRDWKLKHLWHDNGRICI